MSRDSFISIALGILLGFVGSVVIGYVAAIAIPQGFFSWFSDRSATWLALIILGLWDQFLSFGLLAILAGYVIGRISLKNWLLNSFLCYLSVVVYLTIGLSFFYGTPISLFFIGFIQVYILPALILPGCLFLSTFLSANRYRKLNHSSTLGV